jgi:hypothetical protein
MAAMLNRANILIIIIVLSLLFACFPANATKISAAANARTMVGTEYLPYGISGDATAYSTLLSGLPCGFTIGNSLTKSGCALNTTQPADRNVSITSDTITATDSGKIIVYSNVSPTAVGIASASSTGLTQGFGVYLNVAAGAGTVTLTPVGSLINGASTLALAAGTGCYIRSDGTNYLPDLSNCTALLAPSAFTNALIASNITGTFNQSVLPANTKHRVVGLTVDGGGSAISTGVKGYYRVPFAGAIVGYSLISDLSGSTVVDIWKAAGAVPTVSNTITASALPTLSSSQFLNSTTLTGWTTTVAVGDVIGFNINSASTMTRLTIQIYIDTN